MSTPFICAACGVQFAEASSHPARCPICEDSRAFGKERGERQRWTTLAQLRRTHRNRLREIDQGVVSFTMEPTFSVGHQCLIVQGRAGNILWDCLSLVDDATVEAVRNLGGVSAMALSHPHFYGSMVEWSRACGNVPIYVHAADREWVLRGDPAVVFWDGDNLSLNEEFTLVRCGGHFDGGAVLHQASRNDRAGRLFTGDVIAVLDDREGVTFMHNFPEQIRLPASAIRRIAEAIEPFEFDRIYGCWPQNLIPTGGKAAVLRSAETYVQHAGS